MLVILNLSQPAMGYQWKGGKMSHESQYEKQHDNNLRGTLSQRTAATANLVPVTHAGVQCMCKKNGIECRSYCHKGVQCNNKVVKTTAEKEEIQREEEDVTMVTEEGTLM